jgi:ubiquinol-cytochrome c reductase cytochrome c subunit
MREELGDRLRGRRPFVSFALLVALALLMAAPVFLPVAAWAQSPSPSAVGSSPLPATPLPVASPTTLPAPMPSPAPAGPGAATFAQNCSGCHGATGEGNARGPFYGPSLRAAAAQSLVVQMVERGRQAPTPARVQMPAFAGILSGQQIQEVAAYVSGELSDPAARSAQASDGGEIFRLYCSGCHSAAARGGAIVEGANAPNLRRYPAAVALAAVIIGPGNMPVFTSGTLDTRQQTAAALYVQALQTAPPYGGNDLGAIGPVAEGLAATVALALLVVFTVWVEWRKGRARD